MSLLLSVSSYSLEKCLLKWWPPEGATDGLESWSSKEDEEGKMKQKEKVIKSQILNHSLLASNLISYFYYYYRI